MSDKTKNTKDIIYYIVAKDYMPNPLTWGNALFIIDDEGEKISGPFDNMDDAEKALEQL